MLFFFTRRIGYKREGEMGRGGDGERGRWGDCGRLREIAGDGEKGERRGFWEKS